MASKEVKEAARTAARQRSAEVTYVANKILAYSKASGRLNFQVKVDFPEEQPWPNGLCERSCTVVVGAEEHSLSIKQMFAVCRAADAMGKLGMRDSSDCDQEIAIDELFKLSSKGFIDWA